MTQAVTKWNYLDQFTVRTVEIDGQPWFVARDVCRCLGLDGGSTARHLKGIRADERQVVTRTSVILGDGGWALFGNTDAPALAIISESGLYKLIMRSDKPQARQFQDWVTRVVIPAIRKDGATSAGIAKALDTMTITTGDGTYHFSSTDHSGLTVAQVAITRDVNGTLQPTAFTKSKIGG